MVDEQEPHSNYDIMHLQLLFWILISSSGIGLSCVILWPSSEVRSLSILAALLCLMPTGLAFLLRKRPDLVSLAGPAVCVAAAAYMTLSLWYYTFLTFNDFELAEEVKGIAPWIPVVTMLSFVMARRKHAEYFAFAFFGLTCLPILLHLTFGGGTLRASASSLTLFLQFVMSHGLIIAILRVFARTSERFLDAREKVTAFKHLAKTDALTQLPNRRALEESLARLLSRASTVGPTFSVALLDVDHFKKVNDHYGHDVGDKVLKELAQLVKSELRDTDIFGRWGGEEFLVILPGCGAGGAEAISTRLRRAIERSSIGGLSHVTSSLGVATYETDDTPGEIIRRADRGLYQAKEDGRNCVRWVKANHLASALLTQKMEVNLARP